MRLRRRQRTISSTSGYRSCATSVRRLQRCRSGAAPARRLARALVQRLHHLAPSRAETARQVARPTASRQPDRVTPLRHWHPCSTRASPAPRDGGVTPPSPTRLANGGAHALALGARGERLPFRG